MSKSILLIVLFFLIIPEAYAVQEQIFITYDGLSDSIIFDGKWSFYSEWKPTSLMEIKENQQYFVIRTAHDYENIYLMVNFVSDESYEKNSDKAIVCIDGKANKNNIPDADDYCFILRLGSDSPITLQGGNIIPNKNHLNTIRNDENLIGISSMSDQNDRYSKTPHATYEYKIPLEIFGKSDVYGLYVGIYDDKTKEWQSWPVNTTPEKYPFIPSPSLWGEVISPDKSIPEFSLIFLVFPIILSIVIVGSKFYYKKQK